MSKSLVDLILKYQIIYNKEKAGAKLSDEEKTYLIKYKDAIEYPIKRTKKKI